MPNPENLKGKEFKKGQSGNPAGRPKKLPEIKELFAVVLGEMEGGMTRAEQIIRKLVGKAVGGDIHAATFIFSYAYAKPRDNTDINAGNVTIRVIRDTPTTEVIEEAA